MGLGSQIRDPGVKKVPNPGSGSATPLGSSKETLKVDKYVPYSCNCKLLTPISVT
jgi:hypothetical protein